MFCPIDGNIDGKAELHGVLADDREEWDDAAEVGEMQLPASRQESNGSSSHIYPTPFITSNSSSIKDFIVREQNKLSQIFLPFDVKVKHGQWLGERRGVGDIVVP